MRIESRWFSTRENPIKIYLYGPRVIIPRHEQNPDSSLQPPPQCSTSNDSYRRIITVVAIEKVEIESSSLFKRRRSYETSNCFKSTLYKHSFTTRKGKCDNSEKVGTLEIQKETNSSIGGFLASHHRSPLIVCFPFHAFQIIEARSIQHTDFLCIINYY